MGLDGVLKESPRVEDHKTQGLCAVEFVSKFTENFYMKNDIFDTRGDSENKF